MDILDIDEALKDDSFIFLADKTHDDVSNILQQWKSNNSGLPPPPPLVHAQQNEQAYKLNSKTFTRPKRKSAQNLETQFTNAAALQQQINNYTAHYTAPTTTTPMINLEIGGLVTNMHKSFLQDTSPPASICSSMEMSSERMNNSLITSADFTNLNFLEINGGGGGGVDGISVDDLSFDLTAKSTADGYTLSDMIRDRKALESLTMSGEGTLIKDSHIGQIDDISLTLSKTASGCSTMDNSTDSVSVVGGTMDTVILANGTFNAGAKNQQNNMQQTMVLSDEMIGDMTFNLVENSMHAGNGERASALNVTHDVCNVTFKKPVTATLQQLDETVLLNQQQQQQQQRVNMTFDTQHQEERTPDSRCETPESVDKKLSAFDVCESTPLVTSERYLRNNNNIHNNNNNSKHTYATSIKLREDVNISPIVAALNNDLGRQNTSRVMLNNTFEPKPRVALSSETFSGTTGLPKFSDTMEMLDNIENPIETSTTAKDMVTEQLNLEQQQAEDARIQMQCVMDLAEAEVELLAEQNDEEQFEHMLDELGRVELNAEQLKMQKSLDSIKKRFNYSNNNNINLSVQQPRDLSREAQNMRELTQHMHELLDDDLAIDTQHTLNTTIELKETMRQSRRDTSGEVSRRDLTTSNSGSGMLNSSNQSGSQSSERLLSRRSRLYDDVNLSMLNNSSSGSNNSLQQARSTSQSFTVQQMETEQTTQAPQTEQYVEMEKLETEQPSVVAATPSPSSYKLAEKRERDRERFKTIKITKQRTELIDGVTASETELNVPCIDDDDDELDVEGEGDVEVNNSADAYNEAKEEEVQPTQQQQKRFSRRDRKTPDVVFNNNKTEIEPEARTHSNNYLTYKKPKDKLPKRNLPEILVAPTAAELTETTIAPRLEPRSLSRPRYISGLQKFSAVSKATSAGDLQKTTTAQATGSNKYLNATLDASDRSGIAKVASRGAVVSGATGGELKSPMGIKSKSFHNLSSNIGGSGVVVPRASFGYGLKKPGSSLLNTTEQRQSRASSLLRTTGTATATTTEKNNDDAVFKVPKLVSGLRAPNSTVSGLKQRGNAGLARPSSGYYSLNVNAKANITAPADCELEVSGRHSPTESLSSASSRGSLYNVANNITQPSVSSNSSNTGPKTLMDTTTLFATKLTQITTGASGIPKPSGLRPPSNIKRSGLPRPSSIVRR